ATGACWLTDGVCPCRWCPAAQTPMMPSRSPPPWTALPSGGPARREAEERGDAPHVRLRGEELAGMDKNPGFKARRWVVEVCHSWFNRSRKLLVRHEKMDRSHLGWLMLAASAIVLRKIKRKGQGNIIYGYALSARAD
ncbi:transposase, partial [Methyloglobulus sp.]|uniref:transposase n=1 Tax=Methyloglobulus sp. TaxID=2518622 RepID=UPI0039898503